MDFNQAETALDRVMERKGTFLLVFFLVFISSYIVLVAIDFVPEPPAIDSKNTSEVEGVDAFKEVEVINTTTLENQDLAIATTEESILPNSIYIEKLDLEVAVVNPTSRTIADLDAALLKGVVRHPDSANLSQDGNVFILGHSSYLPNVINSSFQAFNGIQKLEWGDIIEVTSDDYVHVYQVEKVFEAKAQNVTVPIAGDSKRLTLATCNSFGSTDDRYVVEAKQIEVRRI